MNNNALYNINCGLFVLTAKDGTKQNGCIINTVMQVTSSPVKISATVNKTNFTAEMIMKTKQFCVSCIDESADFSLFERFGFASGRDVDKFNGYNENTTNSQTLLVPAHYGRDLYSFYLMMKIDFVNAEYAKYNTNAALFQSAYDGFATFYHNRHMPLQPNSINFGKRDDVSYGNPLSDN